eukprot:1740285-Ditylum_brightwellii.AAC.1
MSTAFGLSEHMNWFDRIAPVFEIGQGAVDRPPGWGAIIDIVLKVYAKLAKGCTIKHIQKQGADSLKTNADAFVDGATLLHNNDQFNASGLLEFLKSSYFLMIWKFTEDGEPYIVDEADLPENKVRLIDASGNAMKLKRFAPNKGIKMLGLHKAATLQESTEFAYIQAKAE